MMPILLRRIWNGKPHFSLYRGDVVRPALREGMGERAIPISDRQAKMGLDALVQFFEAGVIGK